MQSGRFSELGAASESTHSVVPARTRFLRYGWHGAGMHEIARDAGVSVETVYSNLPSKAAAFKEVLNLLVVGDDQPIPLAERPEFRAATVGSLTERLRALAAIHTEVQGRVAGLRMVLREAARADDDLAGIERMVRSVIPRPVAWTIETFQIP